MKTKYIISLVFCLVSSIGIEGQSQNEDLAPQSSRQFISQVSLQLNERISNGDYLAIDRIIADQLPRCQSMSDRTTCEAGLYFLGGHQYQTALLKAKSVKHELRFSAGEFREKAEAYYQRVLEYFPDNEAALSNLYKLKEADGVNESTIGRLEALSEQFPSEKVEYLVRIGDLYKGENALSQACEYYYKAYRHDPYSELACKRVVELFLEHQVYCPENQEIIGLAAYCIEIDLPHYAEQVLRKALILEVRKGEISIAQQILLLWTDVLVTNQWLSTSRINQLRKALNSAQGRFPASDNEINDALTELETIILSDSPRSAVDIQFWNVPWPEVRIGDNRLTPLSIWIKILHAKGQDAYFRGDYESAEELWKGGMSRAYQFDNAYFTKIATDLAQLYQELPGLDPDQVKIESLIIELFNEKGKAYRDKDLEMIRQYHITLSGIFYNQKKWSGNGAANARFQLESALNDRYGEIVNPELRSMLGDVYVVLERPEEAINSYHAAIQDYLSFDQIKEAEKLNKKTQKNMIKYFSRQQQAQYNGLQALIQLRKEMSSPNNPLLLKKTGISEYLSSLSESNQSMTGLPSNFVAQQYFKGLSDLSANMPPDRQKESQMLYSSALERLKSAKNLASMGDFNRVDNIQRSLEKSVVQSKRMEFSQVNKKVSFSYASIEPATRFTTYSVPGINREIKIPAQLFELNGVLQKSYIENKGVRVARVELSSGIYRVIENNR